jgi:hypothetical protein
VRTAIKIKRMIRSEEKIEEQAMRNERADR